jgi:hypothetical protein
MSTSPVPLRRWSASLLSEEKSSAVITTVFSNALDLMLLGFPSESTRLLKELNQHNAFMFEGNYLIMQAMHYAWDSQQSWPDFVKNPDKKKPFYIYQRPSGTGGTSEEFLAQLETASRRDWPPELSEKYPNFEMGDLNTAISALNAQDRSEYFYAHGKNILACAVEIALALDEEAQAKDLVKNHVVPEYSRLDGATESSDTLGEKNHTAWRQQIAQSRRFWNSPVSQIVRQELEIDTEAIKKYVDEGVSFIDTRFTKGPESPLAGMSISELVKIMDDNYVAARRANVHSGGNMTVKGFDPANVPKSFLRAGATEDEIAALEEKLGVKLPNDYKEFLRITNGFYDDDPDSPTAIFYGTVGVKMDDTISDCQQGVELLPYPYTSLKLMEEFDWPEVKEAFSIGPTGDEGNAWLFPRKDIEEGLAEFERVYQEANEGDRAVYEQGAKDLYGGLEKMRAAEWLIITWAHWKPEPEPYPGFRAYLEHEVQVSEKTREQDEADQRGVKRKREEDSDGSSPDGETSEDEAVLESTE